MVLFKTKHRLVLIPLLLMLITALTAQAEQAPAVAGFRLSPGSHPAAESVFVPAFDAAQEPAINNAWYQRSGGKKGLTGALESDEERAVAADTAVLARGFSDPWRTLLAEHQEPSVLVGPDDIAGLSPTKKLLIIPTGALSGAAESVFFRAGIEEFARNGGIVFCLAQRSGRDYSALPASQGKQVQAKGWEEDAGPLFRSSTVQMNHPLLSGLSVPSPSIETEGYITAPPPGSRILLARHDGYPTLIIYPFSKGWIIISTLFTDFSALSGGMEADERTIIKNLLAWSLAADQPQQEAPQTPASSAPIIPGKNIAPAATAENSGQILNVRTTVGKMDNFLRIAFNVPPTPRLNNETLLVRTGGQEKTISLSATENRTLLFEVPLPKEKRAAYKFYQQNGRSVLRGSVAVAESEDVIPGQTIFLPGQPASIRLAGLPQGELTLSGIGYFDSVVTSGTDTIQVPIPSGLPAGTYRMEWQLNHLKGGKHGEFGIDVAGTRVDVENLEITKKRQNERIVATASVRVRANQKVSGTLRLMLRGPRGEQVFLAEPVLSLTEGVQTIPVPFTFTPQSAGIWELIGSFMVRTPEGVGLPSEPVALALKSVLFDIGDAAILSLAADKHFYYQPAGSVTITAAVFGRGTKNIRVFLDSREIAREKMELTGITRYDRALPSLDPGLHQIRFETESDPGVSSRELKMVYGFLLPDLAVSIKSDKPGAGAQGPEMPLTVQLVNQGKSRTAASRLIVYDGDPSRDGTVIKKLEVPALDPGERHSSLVAWDLYGKAGKHVLYAVADANDAMKESGEQNNKASLETEIPELLLTALPAEKSTFAADEAISLPFSVFNLRADSLEGVKLVTSVKDPSGRSLAQQTITLDPVSPGKENKVLPALVLASPGIGTYTLSAAIWTKREVSSAVAGFSILPTLSLKGSLEGAPGVAVLCKPFMIDYIIRNSGNILPSSGTVWVEVVRPGVDKPLFTRQFPLNIGKNNVKIENMDLPAGAYLIRVRAKAESEQHQVTRELIVLESGLEVTGPVEAVRLNFSFPRVLVWIGREGRRVEQAVSESVVKQAFEQEDVYFKMVDSEEAFSTQAKTGLFNTYILLEPEEPLKTEWLKTRLEQGQGVLIIGSGETAQAVLQDFGFSLEEVPAKQTTAMTFSRDSGLDLSGTMPVSGKMLSARKRGTTPAAVYAPAGQSAVVIEKAGRGRLIAMPLSVSRSASTGATALYSLAIRKMAFYAAPEKDDGLGASAGGLLLSSKGGQIRAVIKAAFPEGASVLWSNLEGKPDRNVITFDLELDREPRKLLYLYSSPASGTKFPRIDASYQCGGSFADQGKVE